LLEQAGDIVARYLPGDKEKEAAKLELLKVQQSYEIEIEKIAQAANQMYINDIEGARNMQIAALNQSDIFSKRFTNYLAVGVLGFAVIFDVCMFFVNYPIANRDMINQVSGVINAGALISVISFYFGSSQSSKDKQTVIENLAGK
jgi:hypothetical protein